MHTSEFINYQENRFELFCKVAIRNAACDNHRKRANWNKHFSSLDEMQQDSANIDHFEDSYVTYTRNYRIKGIDIIISDESIGEAVHYIMPNQRAVLLLSFFKDYSDMEIARLLGISHKTVAYRKKNAMTKLKLLVEGMNHGEEEN